MLKRFFGRREMAVEPTPALPNAKNGGHGDHWGCVIRTIEEKKLVLYLVDVTKADNHPETFTVPATGQRGLAFRSPVGPVRTVVLVTNNFMSSAYPEAVGSDVWPVTLTEIVPWSNGIEGQLRGVCHDADVRFFDTRFYANQRRYEVGETYNFRMGALAYRAGISTDMEFDSEQVGAKVSLKGAHAFMPADASNEEGEADIDDYWFHSPLEAEPTRTKLGDYNLTAYPIIMAIPGDFEMRVTLYAGDHVIDPNMAGVKLEDDLEGYLWLHGHLDD